MKYDNWTQYGVHEKTDRMLLAAYTSALFTSGLLGDILILVGSWRYKAIKLHQLMVVFIQYIAVADVLLTIFRVLPVTVSFVENRWIFGEVYCRVGYFVLCSVGGTLYLLIPALTSTKLLIVKYPLRSISFPAKVAHLVTLVCFLFAVLVTMLASITKVDDIYFSYLTYMCEMDRSPATDGWTVWFSFILSGFICAVGTLVVVVSCVMLLAIAKRLTDRGPGALQWRGIMTVLFTAAFFLLATLPMAVYMLVYCFLKENSHWVVYLFKVANLLSSLNVASNFYIYTLTLTSFRQFLRSRIRLLWAPFTRCWATNKAEITSGRGDRQKLLTT